MAVTDLQVRKDLYIGGEWIPSDGSGTIDVIGAATEELIGQVPDGTTGDIDRAVAAARRAFDEGPWPKMSPAERAEVLARLSAGLQARSQDIADLISMQNGSPKSFSLMGQVFASTMVLDNYVRLAGEYEWEQERTGSFGFPLKVRRAPVGVVGAITPWNVPLFIAALKLGPAMITGCTVVLKPAPETPLDSYLLAEAAIEAGVPEGVLNIVPAGRDSGEHLVLHPLVDKISFTGSTVAGSRIGELCGKQFKRCTLELGGKSAAIVLDDVDLSDATVADLVNAGVMNNGQVCGAQSRILVSRNRYEEVVDALGQAVGALTVGDPLDDATQIGPLVAERQRTRVEGYIESGKADARLVVGGDRPDQDRGWYVAPTVFADVDNKMKIAQEEIFGPVLSVIPYANEDEAVAIANDSDYGLCGSVWTADPQHGAELGARVRTGVVSINTSMILDPNAPFGGFKHSGVGRELGKEGIDPYTELQSIILPIS